MRKSSIYLIIAIGMLDVIITVGMLVGVDIIAAGLSNEAYKVGFNPPIKACDILEDRANPIYAIVISKHNLSKKVP
jgi:hypothetical protein